MSDAKGVEKFADEFVVGTVGFIYSAAATIALVLSQPIRGPLKFRALKRPEFKALSAPVAMFLSYMGLVLVASSAERAPGRTLKDILAFTDFSGLFWYEKLIAIALLYIVSDLLVRIAGRLFTRRGRHYDRDCDRLRYAIAGSAVIMTVALSLMQMASVVPGELASALGGTGVAIFYLGTSWLLAIVLGSMVRARFQVRRRASIVLAYVVVLPLIWLGAAAALGASFLVYITLDSAIRYEVPPLPPQEGTIRVPRLLCLIQPDGRITVSALLHNDSNKIAFLAPDGFSLALAHKAFQGGLLTVPVLGVKSPSPPPERTFSFTLRTGSEFAATIAPHETRLVTFMTAPLTANMLSWPPNETQACRLDRVAEYSYPSDDGETFTSYPAKVRLMR